MSAFAQAMNDAEPFRVDEQVDNHETNELRLFDIAEMQARTPRILTETPPKRQWVVDALIPLGESGLLLATGGTGKGMTALDLGLCVATGKPFFGHTTSQGGVLFIETEDSQAELDRRTYYIAAQKFELTDHPAMQRNFVAKSLVAQDCRLTQTSNGSVVPTGFADRIIETVRDLVGLQLIVVSPLARFNGGDENFSADATRLVEQLEVIAKATDAAVLAIHHTNKNSLRDDIRNQAAARGSSAFVDGVRYAMLLSPPNDKEARKLPGGEDERKNFVKFSLVKANYGPPQPDIWLRRGPYGVLFQHEVTANQEETTGQTALIAAIVQTLTDGDPTTKTAFIKRHAGLSGTFGVAEKPLFEAIDHAVEASVLAYVQGDRADRKWLVVVRQPTRVEL